MPSTREELLQRMLAKKGIALTGERDRIPIRADRDRAPLSFAQERLWFMDRVASGSPIYNVPMKSRLDGRLDLPAFRAALSDVVQRHEVLRTVFRDGPSGPVQVIGSSCRVPVPLVDVSSLPAGVRSSEEQRLAHWEASRPFDLERGPVVRVLLLRSDVERHVIQVTMHHIVSDAWSKGVFRADLAAFYRARMRGERPVLPELPVQFADYASWQRERFDEEELSEHLDFWRKHLAGAPDRLRLPVDRPHPRERSFRGATLPVELPAEVAQRLDRLGREEGCTSFMTLFACFVVLLGRICGQDDLVVGSPVAWRDREELERLIGFLVNVLPLRGDLSGRPTFRELLRRVRRTAVEVHDHQIVPFEMLVDELASRRDLAHNPLFQVVFALQNVPVQRVEVSTEQRLVGLPAETGTAKFDLTVAFSGAGERVAGTAEYNVDVFDRTTVRRLLRQFAVVAQSAAVDPEAPVDALDLLSLGECHQLLVEWSGSRGDGCGEVSISRLLADRIAELPEAVAVTDGDRVLTYRGLARISGAVARSLRGAGLRPGAAVGVALPRSAELVGVLAGILEAGCVYVPLDASAPEQRLASIARDAGLKAVIGDAELSTAVAPGAPRIRVDEEPPVELGDALLTGPLRSGRERAYVIYTSGSAGAPKGVAVSHRAVIRLVRENGYLQIAPGDRIGHASNPAFDATTFEIWGALLNGGVVVVLPDEGVLSPDDLGPELVRRRVDHLFLTTSLFNEVARRAPAAFSRLDTLMVGGEAADPRRMADVLDQAPPGRMLNVYGPTENTTFSTWHPMEVPDRTARSVPIGWPIAAGSVLVADARCRPVPIGVIGELLLGGDGLAEGYPGRPALTAERFVPDPWGFLGDRLYRTGDLVRRLPDGSLDFHARADHQVKLRGFRIELGEIGSVLGEHPEVAEAVAVLREDVPDVRRIVAYAVPVQGTSPGSTDLGRFLRRKLPDYMVPGAFVLLDALPLTPNGKLDRRSLPAPEGREATIGALAPRGPVEEVLAGQWGEVLGVESVGVEEDFFELGGNSLLVTRLIARIRDVFRCELPIRSVFERPTIAELATEVVEAAGGERAASRLAQASLELARLSPEEIRELEGEG